jgi:YtxH-like protein
MRISKLVRSMLKTAVYIMDQTADRVDRATTRATEMVDDAHDMVYPPNHTLRNVVSFAAGIGVGVGVGILMAPSSGAELRGSISDKVQDIGNRVRRRSEAVATGSDIR